MEPLTPPHGSASSPSDETLYDPEPDFDMPDVYVLPVEGAETWGVTPAPTTWQSWVANGGDPRLYPYSPGEYAQQEHWWIAELNTYPTADLEAELEHVTRQIVEHTLLTDDVLSMIGAVYDKPTLEGRAQWLAWEIKRRNALPEPPKPGFRIPADFVRRLKDSLDLPQFLMAPPFSMALKRQGRDWLGLCPYHTEKSPSFLVHKDRAHCFGCQQSADVFDILLVSSICRTWREAVEYVAEYVGVAMPKPPEPVRLAPPVIRPSQPKAIWEQYPA